MKAWNTWERVLLALLCGVLLAFGVGQPGFMSLDTLADSSFNFSEKGLLALALALLIVCGEIDLSIAAILALSSLAMGLALRAGFGPWAIAGAALLSGMLAGAFNGLLVARCGLPSIVVTIGTLSLYRGLALVVLGEQSISGYPEIFSTLGNAYLSEITGLRWLRVPIEFGLLLVFALALGLLLHRSTMGRRIYAIGANPVAARFSGVAVGRYRFALFVLSGLMAAVAAILLTGRIGSTRPNIALGWELDAITMAILGGVAIEGGRGSIVGTMLAVLLLGLFSFGMGMANVSGIVMSMVVGVLLIVSMILPRLLPRPGVRA
ncbi:ABC transporter permease [Verminephrobacter aporrectodeae]|uniref:Autoinducer 2 import system permease protein LsrD n=1 Tax=Verminephrobacter aporrectodeae subsp. tuberculatae TaxID=1110392 RepID=A0ABT3KVX6_9BURK|nr:ABC transporter permease [Verminephrobacter aporrectodeae]MCW5222148.1 ABC transporter permease [Verminephrobacter aporrectodeae subsp. tuberculatae]MCW5291439.1 ABC transporter permease [Verminephrobacter aporrectodeae subsp. tuberculatae]MCW5322391.1 ABC transporter permease [Verminephrobacter aporrectodeae subsp. tuberculatae]MCW8175747.1 ABC transporter permease [Verminephrobacter aporrectodeae subsp. tuberculatae]MCW8203309.1 ABC transporter permease [Verminephrobacter aporrectodeae su